MRDVKKENVELVEAASGAIPAADRRPHIPQPLPVRLVAVEDVRLTAKPEFSEELDAFYVELLGFEREHMQTHNIYHAENLSLHIHLIDELPERDLRPLGIEVESLADIAQRLNEREIEFELQKGLLPGQRTVLLQDPAGNWVAISQAPLL